MYHVPYIQTHLADDTIVGAAAISLKQGNKDTNSDKYNNQEKETTDY